MKAAPYCLSGLRDYFAAFAVRGSDLNAKGAKEALRALRLIRNPHPAFGGLAAAGEFW